MVDQGVAMHRLVQSVLRDHTPAPERDGTRQTVHAVLAAADPGDPASWARYAQLYPHALATNMVDSNGEDARNVVTRLIQYLRSAGDYPNSLALARHAYRQRRHTLGEDHPDTITAAANLAATLQALGD